MDQSYAAWAGGLAIPLVAPLPQYQLFQFVHTDAEGILLPVLCDLGNIHVSLGQVASKKACQREVSEINAKTEKRQYSPLIELEGMPGARG